MAAARQKEAKRGKTKGLLGDILNESRKELEGEEDDEEFDLSKQSRTGPDAFDKRSRQQSEGVIDELLLSVPNAQGYYLKLHKEIAPNDWMLKKRIDEYSQWTDLEHEIAQLVYAHTKTAHGTTWGTGRYRITVWNNKGMRGGDKYPPIYFNIDASEHEKVGGTASMGGDAATIIESVRNLIPQQNPGDTIKLVTESFMKGMEVTKNDSSSLATIMSSMMTAITAQSNQTMQMIVPLLTAMMNNNNQSVGTRDPESRLLQTIQMLQTMGVVGQKEQDPLAILDKLKAAGYINNQNVDAMSQFGSLKQLIGIVRDITGDNKGEKPTMMEKAIDALAPHLGSIVSTIMQSSNARAQMIAASQQHRPMPSPAISAPSQAGTVHPQGVVVQPTAIPTQPIRPQINQGFEVVYQAIKQNNHGFFPVLAELFRTNAPQMLEDMVTDKINEAGLVEMLKNFGGDGFKEAAWQPDLLTYSAAFIAWLKKTVIEQQSIQPHNPMPSQVPTRVPNPTTMYATQCEQCGFGFDFPNQEAFLAEQTQGGGKVVCGEGNPPCAGIVKPRIEVLK